MIETNREGVPIHRVLFIPLLLQDVSGLHVEFLFHLNLNVEGSVRLSTTLRNNFGFFRPTTTERRGSDPVLSFLF